jgi:TRAP transporter TAXI family solute receptor
MKTTSSRAYRCFSTLLLVISAAVLLSSCAREETPVVVIGTGGIGGNYQLIGNAIARVTNKNLRSNGFQISDEPSEGSVSNINAVVAGQIQFGIAQADHQYEAVQGIAAWQEPGAQSSLRSVLSLYPEAVTLIAGANAGIETMEDLRGRRVDIGMTGSGTRQNALDALEAADIDWQQDIQAQQVNLEERLAMLMHSELDAFFYTVGHPNTDIKFATYSVRGARFIPLVNINEILENNPFYSETLIPADLYERAYNAEDIETVGVKATLVTSSDVSDEVVYAITKSVFEQLEEIAEYRPVMRNVSQQSMLEGLTAPVHPGAMKYFAELGLELPAPAK